jgi:hypothetical protein
MRYLRFSILALFLVASGLAQSAPNDQPTRGSAGSPLDVRIDRFDIDDAVLRDALSELSLKGVEGLHLGFEEIIRNRIQDDPRTLSPHFSLHLESRTVKQVLDALCASDARYTWSQDGESVNVYPKSTKDDSRYLLNLQIDRVAFKDVPDPDRALTPLFKLFPEQQIGYFGPGLGNNTYAEPWTAVFERLTVRQFANRLAEHMGPRTSWVWEGGQQERAFTFLKGGFNTSHTTK